MTDTTPSPDRSRRAAVAGWLLCAAPLVSVLELALHAKQTTRDVVPEADWVAARDAVKADLAPSDLIVFEPFWAAPLGRRTFGELATLKREGLSDERRFPRAFEVSIRGARSGALAGWKKQSERTVGAITVTLWENPAPTPVLADLVDLVTPERLAVSRVDGAAEQPCSFQRGASQGGSTVVPQGLLTPADRFVCSGGHVGVSVLHGLDHRPRLCIYATPLPHGTLRMRFRDVPFGTSIHGHSGIQWVDERTPAPEHVTLSFSALDHALGTHAHAVGRGWGGFELPTPELDGTRGELVLDLAPSGHRQFCFEATTRREASP